MIRILEALRFHRRYKSARVNVFWPMLRSITPANSRASMCDSEDSFAPSMRIESLLFHVAMTQNYMANHGRSILIGCEIRQPIWVACAISAMKIVGRWLSTHIATKNTSHRFSTVGKTTALPRRALRPVRCICRIEDCPSPDGSLVD